MVSSAASGAAFDPGSRLRHHRHARSWKTAWAAGVRLGYLVAPNVLSYVNGGYSGSHWSGSNFLTGVAGVPSGLHTNSFNTQRLVRRRRRREQPEHLRHHRARLVHEDRISFGLSTTTRPSTNWSTAPTCSTGRDITLQAAGTDHQHLAGLPLQLGWPGRREVLISAKSAAQKPRHRPGLFCACAASADCRPARRRQIRCTCQRCKAPCSAAGAMNDAPAAHDGPLVAPDHSALAAPSALYSIDSYGRPSQWFSGHPAASAPGDAKAATGGNPWPDCS